MVAVLVALTLARQTFFSNYSYLWIGEGGEMLTIPKTSPTYPLKCQLYATNRHIEFPEPKEVPNGDFVALWQGSTKMNVGAVSGEPWAKKAYIIPSESAGDHGEARITVGPRDAYGRPLSLNLALYRETGSLKIGESFFPLGPLSIISFKGAFKDDHILFETGDEKVTEPNDRGLASYGPTSYPVISGTLTYNGVRRLIKGLRVGARAAFEVVGVKYGEVLGEGYAEWCPSSGRAQKMRDGDEKETDEIILWVKIPELAGGQEVTLKRDKQKK